MYQYIQLPKVLAALRWLKSNLLYSDHAGADLGILVGGVVVTVARKMFETMPTLNHAHLNELRPPKQWFINLQY